MSSVQVPHFALPFQFALDPHGEIHAVVNEQDSVDDVAACIIAIVRTPIGFREELPEFGVRDMTFSQGGVDVDEIQTAITLWEPRADVMIEEDPSLLQFFVDQVTVQQGPVNPIVPTVPEQDA